MGCPLVAPGTADPCCRLSQLQQEKSVPSASTRLPTRASSPAATRTSAAPVPGGSSGTRPDAPCVAGRSRRWPRLGILLSWVLERASWCRCRALSLALAEGGGAALPSFWRRVGNAGQWRRDGSRSQWLCPSSAGWGQRSQEMPLSAHPELPPRLEKVASNGPARVSPLCLVPSSLLPAKAFNSPWGSATMDLATPGTPSPRSSQNPPVSARRAFV